MKTKPRTLTAAAQILQSRVVRSVRPKGTQGMAWQADAWMYYDLIGEFSMGVDLQAWAVSQGRLVAAIDVPNQDDPEIVSGEPDAEGKPPSEADQIAADLVAGFAGGTAGQQQILRRVATQLLVSAEAFIVGRDMPDGTQQWDTYSREEVRYSQAGWRIDDGIDKFLLDENDVLIRVWMPHPKRRQEPRSGTKPLLPVMAEIHAVTQSIAAQVDSRLAGAGMLILPASVELVGSQNNSDAVTDGQDPFVAEVIDMMVTPIKDRDSAAAVVPIIVKVPDEAVGKIQHIRFESTTDMHDAEKREAAVVRLARGMDLPPEQITGMGDTNHWTGWVLAEQTIKGPVSSLLAVIVEALTIGWYRPALEEAYEAAGITDPVDDQMVWFDTTALEQRPDRSEQAVNVFDRGGLSLAALVRENGFDEDDMPKPEELLRIMLFMLVKARPELAVPLIERAGLLEQILAAAPGVAADPIEDPPVPDDEVNPDNRQLPTRSNDAPGADQGAA